MNDSNMKFFQKIHRLTMIIGLLTIVLPIVFWKKIPDQIPMHYNSAGVVDNWSDKTSLILIFFMVLMLMGIMAIAVYFVKVNMTSKNSKEQEKSEMALVYPAIIIMNLAMQIMFAYIVFCVATCRKLGSFFLPVFLVAVFAPIVVLVVRRPKKPDQSALKECEKGQVGEVYRSKVDWWLGLILGGCVIWLIYLSIMPIIKTGEVNWYMMATMLITNVIIIPLFDIKYVMYSGHLLISMNLYGKVRVRYKDITGVSKTHNPLASAALSLDRVQIDYLENGVQRMVLISPKKKKTFLEELEKRRNK